MRLPNWPRLVRARRAARRRAAAGKKGATSLYARAGATGAPVLAMSRSLRRRSP